MSCLTCQLSNRVGTMHRPERPCACFDAGIDFIGVFDNGRYDKFGSRQRSRASPSVRGLEHLIPQVLGEARQPRSYANAAGVETADMLVTEVFSRRFRDRKTVARYAGLTGSPDESGKRRREKGLARAGSARVRTGMIQFAWRFLRFQEGNALAQWFQTRTADGRGSTRKTMIVALARKLLIALWRLVTTGEMLDDIVLRPAS